MTKAEKRQSREAKKAAFNLAKYGPHKVSAFADFKLKMALRRRVEAEKHAILHPRLCYIRRNRHTFSPAQLFVEVEQYMVLSNQISCKMKPSYTMEEAAMAHQLEKEELTPYICRACGFVHFGHDPKVIKMRVE